MNVATQGNYYTHYDENGKVVMIPFDVITGADAVKTHTTTTQSKNARIGNYNSIDTTFDHPSHSLDIISDSGKGEEDEFVNTVPTDNNIDLEQTLLTQYMCIKNNIEKDAEQRKKHIASMRKKKAALIQIVAKKSHLFTPETLNSVAIGESRSLWITKTDKKPPASISKKCLLWILARSEQTPEDAYRKYKDIDNLMNQYHNMKMKMCMQSCKHSQVFNITIRNREEFAAYRKAMAKKLKSRQEKLENLTPDEIIKKTEEEQLEEKTKLIYTFNELQNNPNTLEVK
jgi:hypothetical protein